MRGTSKHGASHTGTHRTTHHHASVVARAHMSAARKGKPHPHRGHKGPHPGARHPRKKK